MRRLLTCSFGTARLKYDVLFCLLLGILFLFLVGKSIWMFSYEIKGGDDASKTVGALRRKDEDLQLVFIAIFTNSSIEGVINRKRLRQTWISQLDDIAGEMGYLYKYSFFLEENPNPDIRDGDEDENLVYKDMVFMDHPHTPTDSDSDTFDKHMLRYIKKNHKPDFVLRLEDDVFIHPYGFFQVHEQTMHNNQNLIMSDSISEIYDDASNMVYKHHFSTRNYMLSKIALRAVLGYKLGNPSEALWIGDRVYFLVDEPHILGFEPDYFKLEYGACGDESEGILIKTKDFYCTWKFYQNIDTACCG